MEREDLLGNVRRNEDYFHDQLAALTDRHAIIGDVRGVGYFKSLELVKDKDTRETFSAEECDVLLRGFLSRRALRARADLPRRRSRRPGDPALAAADRDARAHRRGDRRARRGAAAGRETHANRLTRRLLTFDLERSDRVRCTLVTEVSVALLDARLRRITTGVTGDALLLSLIALLPR